MKKIIYSLVIMIAAGSLFTSCVTNTEPQGIKDMREAKADYIASLSKLNKAEEEVVKAKAAYQTAQIAVVEAEAALKQAEADIARALADAAQLGVEYLDATLQMKLETAKVKAEAEVIKAQEELADAQYKYEQKIRNLAAQSIGLNATERKVLKAAIDSLESAQEDYHEAFVSVENQKMKIWNKEYDHDSIGRGVVDWKAEIAAAEQKIATDEANIADLEEMKEAPETIKAFLEAYRDSVIELRKDSLLAVQQKDLYENTVLDEADEAYKAKVKAFKDDSIPKVPKYLFAEINSDKDTVAKTYPLSGTGKDLDALFAEYVNNLIKNKSEKTAREYGICVDEEIKNINVGGKDVKEADLDTATEILGTIVEALSRHLVVVDDSLNAKKLDTLQKEAAKADTAYWKARKALEAGYTSGDKDEYIKTYEKFFAVTVGSDAADTTKALKKVVFTWSDTTFSFKKEDCIVKFDHSGGDTIIATNTLKIVLDGVDEKGYSAGFKNVNESKIFKGTSGDLTLFAQAILKNQLAKEAENFEFLEVQLDNIKTQYAAIVSDLKAYNDQYAADSKAHKDGVKALYGGANANKYPRVSTLRSSTAVENGKWAFYGKQVEFANEVAAEYPAIVKAAEDAVVAIREKIEDTEAFIDFLEDTYVKYKNLEEGKDYSTVEEIIGRLDRRIGKLEKDIERNQAYIQKCKKNIDKIEAGYDPYTVDLQAEYDQLAELERELEIAEQQLKIAQAYYDEVIEKYGIKDAE